MSGDAEVQRPNASEPATSVERARRELQEVRGALDQITGGASPRALLGELAQSLAADLATFFDLLPMWQTIGLVTQGRGRLRFFRSHERIPHRVVLARIVSARPPAPLGGGYTLTIASIAVLALGEDGVLRSGIVNEQLNLPRDVELTLDPLAWDDMRIRRVPSGSITVRRWEPSGEAHAVAEPGRVIEALTAIAEEVARDSKRDLALLRRFL
ncbi:MAG TPA: hypothetical protein VN600_06960 [Gemmatimonadaceae bacterium]|nr:hypothetical protein [Gemmatimonadaceae bacterium]